MAEIVLGIGTSHGPLLSTPPEQWDLRAKADRENPKHFFRGRTYNFDALVEARSPGFAEAARIETRRARFAQCQAALDLLRQKLAEAAPDALVIVGNDQREMFSDELTPAITVFRGERLENIPVTKPETSPGLAIAEKGNCPPGGAVYPGLPELADRIVETLVDSGFDPAQSSKLRADAIRPGIPHAFGFFYNRLAANAPAPSVPVILNVHYPHNRPTVDRCIRLGTVLRAAIARWDRSARVAVIASGGLSHYVIDEELDRQVLHAMSSRDEDGLRKIPEDRFQVGTAEIKNWIPVIAAMNACGLRHRLVDYVPCYRSEAGTGNAMAFALWE
jgi:OH-DDVA oxygenase